jgi:hypothetical protein
MYPPPHMTCMYPPPHMTHDMHVPQDGTGLLDDSGYWQSRIEDARLVSTLKTYFTSSHELKMQRWSSQIPHIIGLFCPYSRSLLTLVWSTQVLSNSDDETLHLSADGSFVWLSHPGINRAVVIRNGVCTSCDRAEGTSFLAAV